MLKILAPAIALAMLAAPLAAQTLERIQETGEIRFGYRADAAPLSFSDKNGLPAGYSPLVCSSIAQGLANFLKMDDLSAVFVAVETSNRFDKVTNGDIDLLCGAATITLRRRESVDFSVPTYVDGTAVMLPVGVENNLASLAGRKVGVRASTTTLEAVTNTLGGEQVNAEIMTFESHGDGLAAMERGDISAYFADQSILYFLHNSSDLSSKFTVSPEILTIEKQGLAMKRGDSDFRLVVDAILSEMFATGVMEQIYAETLPGLTPGVAAKAMYLTSPTQP